MRRICAVLCLLIVSAAVAFGQKARPTLAVLDVGGTKVEQATLDLVYGYIVDKVNRTGKYVIVERSALDKVMKELEVSSSGMVDEKTAMKIGQISGAEYILVSMLTGGDAYALSMRIISVATGRVERTSAKNTKPVSDMEALAGDAVQALFDVDNRIAGRFSTGLGFGYSIPLGDVAAIWSYGLTPLATVTYDLAFEWGTLGFGVCAGVSYLAKNPAIPYDYVTFSIPVSAGARYRTNFGVPFFCSAEAYGGGSVLMVVYGAAYSPAQPLALKPLILGSLGCGWAFSDSFSVTVSGTFTTILMDAAVYMDIAPGLRVEYAF